MWCNYFLSFANNGLGWKFCFRETEFPRFVLCWCYACHHETKRRICRFPAVNFFKIIFIWKFGEIVDCFQQWSTTCSLKRPSLAVSPWPSEKLACTNVRLYTFTHTPFRFSDRSFVHCPLSEVAVDMLPWSTPMGVEAAPESGWRCSPRPRRLLWCSRGGSGVN